VAALPEPKSLAVVTTSAPEIAFTYRPARAKSMEFCSKNPFTFALPLTDSVVTRGPGKTASGKRASTFTL